MAKQSRLLTSLHDAYSGLPEHRKPQEDPGRWPLAVGLFPDQEAELDSLLLPAAKLNSIIDSKTKWEAKVVVSSL